MAATGHAGWDDERLQVLIGRLLRWGVLLSALVVLAGGVLFLARHGHEHPDYSAFRGEPEWTRHPAAFIRALAHGAGQAWIELGLLLLMATPVARVALSVFVFLREGDRLYVGLTLVVLAVLLYSLWFSG
jgi:uncharacterized membrane protein